MQDFLGEKKIHVHVLDIATATGTTGPLAHDILVLAPIGDYATIGGRAAECGQLIHVEPGKTFSSSGRTMIAM